MAQYTKVSIILKDAQSHMDYNRRIIEYLNDRHTDINDNFYTIAIEIADDSNINDYALEGMESLPALRVSDGTEFVYGVNSILAILAKLEIPSQPVQTKASQPEAINQYSSTDDSPDNAFYKMAMEEMQNGEQEDGTEPSTIKAYNQDLLESPLTEKMIEEKAKAYTQIYEDRRKRNGKMAGHRTSKSNSTPPSQRTTPGGGVNVDKFIQNGGFDKGEEMLMRQIAQNLQ